MKICSTIAGLLLIAGPTTSTMAAICEDFSSDPIVAGRFVQETFGTESSFAYQSSNGNLLAILDVDASEAYYLSAPISPLQGTDDFSFSFNFRVASIDDRVIPSVFIGLLTPMHVANHGDGLVMALSSTNGRPAVNANVAQNAGNSGGETILLSLGTDYLAVGTYAASNRQFVVEILGGSNFLTPIGRSTAFATNSAGFLVDRIGMQNDGARSFDQSAGTITVLVDNFCQPGRRSVLLSVTNNNVVEGNTGVTNAIFTFRLSSSLQQTVRVDFATADISAMANQDYRPTNGTLEIPPGLVSTSLVVQVFGDRTAEPDESFKLLLGNPVNAILVATQAVCTITNDDFCLVSIDDIAMTEPVSGTVTGSFTVTLAVSNSQPVSLRYLTADGTATAGNDYTATNRLYIFAPGMLSLTIPITVLADAIYEMDESFFLNLTNITNAICGDCQGIGTITNVNPPAMVSLDRVTDNVREGNSGSTNILIGIHLSAPSGKPVIVRLATSNDTATAGGDYQGTNGFVSINPGQTNANFAVRVFGDAKFEPDETFTVSIIAVTNAVPGIPSVEVVTILNDDEKPFISVFDTFVVEGNSGITNAQFSVRLSSPSYEIITVMYGTADGTATAGSDYLATNQILTFTADVTNLNVLVPVIGDTENEADETFSLALSSPINAMVAISPARCTITNDDRVSLCISNIEVIEGDAGLRDAIFTITLSAPSFQPIMLRYFTQNGSAAAGSDYVGTNMLLTIPVGVLSTNISVKIVGDTNDEVDETFSLLLTNLTNATAACASAVCTIHDDDLPGIRFADIGVVEGNSGFTNLVFTLTLSSTSRDLIEVDYYTADGTATGSADYLATNGTARFQPNALSTTIVVPVIGETSYEADEFLFLNLTNSRNATLFIGQSRGWITNDDLSPLVCFPGDFIIREGTCIDLAITLDYTNAQPVAVRYCLGGAPPDLHSSCGSNCCTVVIQPGMLSTNFQLCIDDNGIDEPDRVFFVDFTFPQGGRYACGQRSMGTIKDNDPPVLFAGGAVGGDGVDGETNLLCFPVWLSNPGDTNVFVDFFLLDGTAIGGEDFVLTNGMLVFPPGVVTQYLCIGLIGDSHYESNETFFVCFTNAVNATLGTFCVTGLITNNDLPPRITINDVAVLEGNTGTNFAVFTVSLSNPTVFETFVNYSTVDGTAVTGLDYIGTNGILHFVPTNRILTITVPVLGDTIDEQDETFIVRLSNPVNATLGRTNGIGTIMDDDMPELNVVGSSVREGNLGTTGLAFTVTLSSTSPVPVMVAFLTKDGGATANGNDYRPTNGVLTFLSGNRTQTVVVSVLGDTVNETNETVFLCLINATNATLRTNQSVGVIVNDDQPCLSITNITVQEPSSGSVNAVFAVRLDSPSAIDISVDLATSNLTAIAGVDFAGQTGTLIFTSGVTTQFITIVVNADGDVESNETFAVTLFNPINAVLCATQGIGTIIDGTVPPILTVSNAMVVEGNSGTTSMVFTATLSKPTTTRIVTVNYATADASTAAGSDYVPTNRTLSLLAGTTATNFAIQVVGDCVLESNETFFVRLTNVQFAALGTNLATGTILNDDPSPTVFITNVTVKELDLGTTNAVFNLWLSCKSSFTACVDYVTVNGSATSGSDYIFTMGTLCFPPGVTNATITVPVKGDFENESNETFHVQLSNPQAALLSTNPATGTILDDDGITVRFLPTTNSANEGSSIRFNLVLSKPPSSLRTVDFKTVDNSAIGGLDYVGTNVRVLFPAGNTNQSVDVLTLSDTEDETNETFFAMLQNPTNVVIETPMGVGTIVDGTPACLTVDNILVIDDGEERLTGTFTISLSSTSSLRTCFRYETRDGTAIAPSDYGYKSEVLCIPPGASNQTVTIDVQGNTRTETNEFFYLVLSNPTNATICPPGYGLCTIVTRFTNVCPMVSLTSPQPGTCLTTPTNRSTIANLNVVANARDSDGVVLRVEFFANSNKIGEARSATTTNTYQATWLNVPVGEYDLVAVAQDNLLCKSTSAPVHLSVSAPAVLSISGRSQLEGNIGLAQMLFDISLASPSCQTVKVDVVTANNTALSEQDYIALATTVFFAPGVTQQQVPVPIMGDTVIEPDETFFVTLTNAMNASIATSLATGSILNDDSNCPVRFVAPLADQTRCVCEVVTFSTSISSPVPYSIVWTANGRVIPGATGTNLTLYSLKPSDAGEYTVSVNTSCTNIMQKAMLYLSGEGVRSPAEPANSGTITIGDDAAVPYPSSIAVSCVPGVLESLSVTLHGFSHEFLGDVDVILVSPSRQAIVLMSDVGDALNVADLTLTFVDGVAPMPRFGPITSGTYAPTNYSDQENEMLPPGTTLVRNLAAFAGQSLNGIWNLYVSDDASRDTGAIRDGWSMTLAWDDRAPRLNALRMTNDTLQFNLVSHGNRTHVLEGSTDLENWFPLGTNVMAGTNMAITIPRLPGRNYAFYRVVRCPCISPGCVSCVARLSAPALLPDGRFQMTLNSTPGKTHVIETSSDLVNWASVSTNTLNTAAMPVVMPRGTNLTHRFYRAIRCP